MTTSETINEIAAALAQAQGEITGAVKDSANPFFKSKYADLASVWDACRAPLSKHGLAIVQSPRADGTLVTVETMLTHASGQWIRDSLSVVAKDDSPQAVGSAITYLRRYALQSFAGVAPDDDDAEAAHGRSRGAVADERVALQGGAVVDRETGEELAEPPPGYHYVSGYAFRNGWHEFRLLKFDSQGGSMKLSTKKNIGSIAEQAQAEHIPVRVKTSPKPNAVGEAYLESIKKLDLKDLPTLRPFANDLPKMDSDGPLPMLTDDDIPFGG